MATASIVFAVAFTAKRRHEYVQVPTGERMLLRHRHASKTSRRLLEEALKRANISIRRGDADVVKAKAGVEILGGPIVDARDSLAKLYREDELPCFHLVSFAGRKGPILVVFGIRHGVGLLTERPMFWLAMRENGTFVDDPKDLPDGALAEMRRISKR